MGGLRPSKNPYQFRTTEGGRVYAQGAGNANGFAVLVPSSQLPEAGEEG